MSSRQQAFESREPDKLPGCQSNAQRPLNVRGLRDTPLNHKLYKVSSSALRNRQRPRCPAMPLPLPPWLGFQKLRASKGGMMVGGVKDSAAYLHPTRGGPVK